MKFWASQPRQPFIGLIVSAMLGIAAADRWEVPLPWVFGGAAAMLLLLLCRPATFSCWLFCAALFFQLHAIRHWDSDARWLAEILAHGPRVVHAAGIVVSEPVKPATWSGNVSGRFVLELESIRIGSESTPLRARVNVDWVSALPADENPLPAYGDRVTLVGGAANIGPTRNPGEFDSTRYQQRLGVYSDVRARFANDCQVQSHGHGNPFRAFAFTTRRWIQNRLEIDLADSPEIRDVINGIVLGLGGESPEDLKTLLQRTGTIHLFVVSGLNIAMLSVIVLVLLRPLGLPRNLIYVLVILILATYTLVTGLRTSSVRSTIMATIVFSSFLVDRRAFSYNSLAFAAFAILICDTDQLFAPGFQFSFTLVFVLIALAGRIQRKLESLAAPDPFLPRVLWSWPLRCRVGCWHVLSSSLGVILASWLGSLLFTVGYFHLFSPGSLVANFLAVPLAFGILSLGLASVLTAKLSLHAAVLFNNANWFVAKFMLVVLHHSANLPGGYIYMEKPGLFPAPRCELNVLDLSDGGSAHVRADHRDWLVDCGDDAHYKRVILPYLRSRGVNRLDGLLLTHGDVKRIGGALAAITDFRPRLLAESTQHDKSITRNRLRTELERELIGLGLYSRGDFIRLGHGATMRVLYPPAGLKRSSAADMALVLQLESAGTRALLMSNSGFSTEQWLMENEPDLRSDIVIKGQHTKDFSGTPDFLARVAPRVVVCSALGYTEPVEKLDAWEKETSAMGITVFRQDHAGAVQINIRDDGYDLRGFVNGQTFRSRAR